MVVKTHNKARGITGLDVGASNVERYFSREIRAVELQLGHLEIRCELAPEFWQGNPEIYDPRLCAWLESKHLCGQVGQGSVSLSMIPSGINSFRLTPALAHAKPVKAESPIRRVPIAV